MIHISATTVPCTLGIFLFPLGPQGILWGGEDHPRSDKEQTNTTLPSGGCVSEGGVNGWTVTLAVSAHPLRGTNRVPTAGDTAVVHTVGGLYGTTWPGKVGEGRWLLGFGGTDIDGALGVHSGYGLVFGLIVCVGWCVGVSECVAACVCVCVWSCAGELCVVWCIVGCVGVFVCFCVRKYMSAHMRCIFFIPRPSKGR
eukprot:GGOE01029086.1.p1 GENE.GGOE01029086.1~~GGOE01029086.1.p1  ORF type:complete len:198 (-),score=1.16 GGOE01029086.1:617-1210(-)